MGSLPLVELQRRLARWIRDPDAPLSLQRRDQAGPPVAGLVRGDARASATERLGIYAGAYQARIRDALSRDLPALASRLGEEGFHDLVKLYLLAFPSEHPSLRFAGSRLPGFLADHPAAAPFRQRWPFAGDLARLEWALVDAFDAPDSGILQRMDLMKIREDAFEELQLFFSSSVIRLSLDWPVQRLVHSAAAPSDAAPVEPAPTEILVWRHGEEPRFRVLPPDEARVLDAARAGALFGALCALLAEELGTRAAAPRAAALLAAWVDAGLLRPPP